MGAIDALKGSRKGSATSGEAPGWRCRYASLAIGGGGTATAVVAAAPFEFADHGFGCIYGHIHSPTGPSIGILGKLF